MGALAECVCTRVRSDDEQAKLQEEHGREAASDTEVMQGKHRVS